MILWILQALLLLWDFIEDKGISHLCWSKSIRIMLGLILAVFTYDYVACWTHSSAQRKECYMSHLRVLVNYKMHLSKSPLAFVSFRAVAFSWVPGGCLGQSGSAAPGSSCWPTSPLRVRPITHILCWKNLITGNGVGCSFYYTSQNKV